MTFGSLFAGIGGFDLGFERAGLRCVWQVERNEWRRWRLAERWPDVPRWDDVRSFFSPGYGTSLYERPDVICGGFPCQDISDAGKRAGIEGKRSGLWSEFSRIVRVLRPRYVVVENVTALLNRGLGRVLGDLAESGYDAEWDGLPASAFGADHERDRLFIVAYPKGGGWDGSSDSFCGFRPTHDGETGPHATEPAGGRVGLTGRRASFREPGLAPFFHGLSARLVDQPNRAIGDSIYVPIAEWIGRRLMECAA